MKPSSLRIFAISRFILEEGRSTFSNFAVDPLRIRVNISANGSVIDIKAPVLPTGFDHPGNLAPEGIFPQTESAHVELSIVSPRPSAKRASMILPHAEFLRS
jgi:hypothetical protein